jgi:probable non-F420 flavinoid oxidoreductase
MTAVGIHASHEQITPSMLLTAMREAEAAGFARAWSSDHFSPWSERQGESGFAWAWLGAAMQATAMPYGVVNAPGQRYHPAIVAQAAATLAELFPGRLSVALGTGEFSNEHITGDPWPRKETRNARLLECVAVIRALFRGEVVDHHGLVTVDRARLWTLPAEPPPLLATAVTPETAALAGDWADGLITINQPLPQLTKVLDAFRGNGGTGKPVAVQAHVAWAETDDEALRIAHDQWRTNVFAPPLCWDLATVEQFDAAAAHVRPEDLHGPVLVSSDLARHVAWIQELSALGLDAVYVHHVGKDQRRFIDAYGEHVLPAL